MAKKKTRKELLKREDAFLAAASQSALWAQEHRTSLVAGVVAIVVLIIAIWGGAEFVHQRNQDASALLEEALVLWDADVITEDEETKADPAGDPPTFATEAAKSEALLAKLNAVVDRAGGGGVGLLARFYIAHHQEGADDKEAAEKSYAALANDLNVNDSFYFLAVERSAYLQEARGARDAAIATLERLLGHESGFYGDWAKYHQGRLHQRKGEIDRARGLFEAIEKDHADSDVVAEVRNRLDQIGRTPPPSDEDPEAAAEEAPEADAPADPANAVAAGKTDDETKSAKGAIAP